MCFGTKFWIHQEYFTQWTSDLVIDDETEIKNIPCLVNAWLWWSSGDPIFISEIATQKISNNNISESELEI